MSEMIERVARAIYEARTGERFIGAGAGPDHDDAFACARAVIAAVREPTRDMIAAVAAASLRGEINHASADDALSQTYRAMIDEALK